MTPYIPTLPGDVIAHPSAPKHAASIIPEPLTSATTRRPWTPSWKLPQYTLDPQWSQTEADELRRGRALEEFVRAQASPRF